MAPIYIVSLVGDGSRVRLSNGRIMTLLQAHRAGYQPSPKGVASFTNPKLIPKTPPVDRSGGTIGSPASVVVTAPKQTSRSAPDGGTVGGYSPTKGDNPLENTTTMPTGNFFDNARPTVPKAGTHSAQDTLATQKFLKAQGYNIAVDGKWGPQTQSAALNWRTTRNSTIWNRSNNATPSTGATIVNPPVKATPGINKYGERGQTVTPKTPPPVVRTPASTGVTKDTLTVPGFKPVPLNFFNTKGALLPTSILPHTDMLDPSMAQSGITNQYAPLLQIMANKLALQGPTTAQHLADISNWYGQVQSSLAAANAGNVAGTNAANASIAGSTKSIMESLGGGANSGTGNIGAEGQAGNNLVAALGQAQGNFLSSMAPILQLAQSGASSQEAARQQGITQDLENQKLQLQSQEQGDLFNRQMQIAQYNSGLTQQEFANRMGLLQYNSGVTQQNQANQMSLMTYNQQGAHQAYADALAKQAALISAGQYGLQAADTQSTINARDAGVTQSAVNQVLKLRQIQAQTAASNAAQAGKISDSQTGAYANAVGGITKMFNIGPDWVVHRGTDPKSVVKALSGQIPGPMTQQKRRLMYATLSQLKTEQGGRLFPDSLLKTYGYA